MTIRTESPSDVHAVRAVNERAFGGRLEANLVDALRREADPFISLVAEDGGLVVGHICFTPVSLIREKDSEGAAEPKARSLRARKGTMNRPVVAGLGPMAILPERQREGIGSVLVREGIARCRDRHFDAIVVLGHPSYYPRFGFAPASRFGIRSEYDVPDDAFMAIELHPSALADTRGIVRYHPAFGRTE